MYKVEIMFNTKDLAQESIKELNFQTDLIFKKEDINSVNIHGRKLYCDQRRKEDYGRMWAAIFELKRNNWITDHIQECFWYNGNDKEDLLTDFIRV